MALEAQEVAVRLKLFGGAAFKAEADSSAASLDRIGAAGKRAGGGVATGLTKSHSVLEKTGAKVSRLGSQMIGFGRTMSMVGVPVAYVGYLAVKSAAQFQQAMTLLSTQAGMAKKSIGPMSAAVEGMAGKFGATPTALADALYPIESIGKRGPEALRALKAAALGSAVGLDSLQNTADAVTTVMASKIKGAGGPVEAMSIMDRAIGLGKMHMQDLTESFKSGIIPISQQFGLSFKQILAAASGLTRVGIPANTVMARMRLTLTSMVAPTTMGLKAMQKMGLTQFQLADDLKKPGGLLTALQDLKSHAAAVGNTDLSNSYIAEMFGKSRGATGILSLLRQLPQIQDIYGKVMGTTPATLQQHFGQTEATSAFKYKQIQAELQVVMIKLGNAINRFLLPVLIKLIPILTSVIRWFGQLPGGVKKFLMVLLAAVVVGGPILMFTGAIVKVGGLLLGGFAGALRLVIGAEGMAGLSGAMSGVIVGFIQLLPAMAAIYALYKLHNPIENAGKSAIGQVGRGVATSLSTLGLAQGPANYFKTSDYLHSAAFRHLDPAQQSAVEWRLGHPHARLTGQNAILAGMGLGTGNILSGVQLPNLPGLQQMVPGFRTQVPRIQGSNPHNAPDTGSISSALNSMSFKGQFTANTYLDHKLIATSVNQYNRKAQNRR